MPSKHEILEELDHLESEDMVPGRYVQYSSTPSKASGRSPTSHVGRVKFVDVALGEPHKAPTVHYEGTKADGTPTIFRNRPTKLEVVSAPKRRRSGGLR
jgi:hypothetical protein